MFWLTYFSLCLFNDALNNSDYIQPNARMIHEQQIVNDAEGSSCALT